MSQGFAAGRLWQEFAGRLGEAACAEAHRAAAAWWRREGAALGPSSSLRQMVGRGAVPLLEVLGYAPARPPAVPDSDATVIPFRGAGSDFPVLVTLWGCRLDGLMSHAAAGRPIVDSSGATWAMGFNGVALRLWDLGRGWTRAYLDISLQHVVEDPTSFRVCWAMARADARPSVARQIAEASDRHGLAVRGALRDGVREALELLVGALARPRVAGDRLSSRVRQSSPQPAAEPAGRQTMALLPEPFEQALTVVYRLLFLLFAESRGLVPTWHPVYQRSYSIESLRTLAERPGRHRGLWASVQAISRLAHAGCRAGDLVVAPFNGRLFAPGRAPLIETAVVDDDVAARAVVAITTTPSPTGRERIAFGDLGVEQLGAVYESVLDYEPVIDVEPARRLPARGSRVRLVSTGLRRKASGTFYTPREMTDYVVRQALEPLTRDAAPEAILALKVLDPAMGSGAFLVSACRFLASAYEQALVRHEGRLAGDVTEEDRAGFRRLIARRCLYGVDINPTAVQVARLSLWLATLAAGKPLGFLDHRLVVGNSLVGASPDDLARRPPGGGHKPRRPVALPLFPEQDLLAGLQRAVVVHDGLARTPDDTAAVVREKERAFGALRARGSPLAAWRASADVWCAGWFWDEEAAPAPTPGELADMGAAARGAATMLPAAVVARRLRHVRRIARLHAFFHWAAEFPEIFRDADGRPRPSAGFDAVITNPPWEMVRADAGPAARRAADRSTHGRLLRFARDSGIYRLCNTGHANLYQFFVERCLRLTRTGGRVGIIVPWGLASDEGCRELRRYLIEQCDTDAIVGFENARALFPIHRSVRFAMLSASPGRPTRAARVHIGLRDPADLERVVPSAESAFDDTVRLTPTTLARVSGSDLAVPWARRRRDLDVLESLRATFPALGEPGGWGLVFGRELNATDDGHILSARGAVVVVEGRHLEPFRVRAAADARRVASLTRLPRRDLRVAVGRWRLGYRDVAAAGNRLTLIAALVPPDHVTVHTVLCLKTPLPLRLQAYLCAMLNSFVANFIVRMWVTTHVNTGILARLPVPRFDPAGPASRRLAALALALRGEGDNDHRYAAVQAAAAGAYGLSPGDFAYVLETFPLVDPALRQRCLDLFEYPARSVETRRS